MNKAFMMSWIESERGWGTRPDGVSLHVSAEAYQTFLDAHWGTMPDGAAPECYSRPDSMTGKVVEVDVVDEALFAELTAAQSMRFYKDLHVRTVNGRFIEVSRISFNKVVPFVDQCLAGTAKPAEVDDFVERWHSGEGKGAELREFLGMSTIEYARWMKDASALYEILFSRVTAVGQSPDFMTHVKTGGTYRVICEAKSEGNLEPVTVYQGLDGQVWVRPSGDFYDGRFVAVK